MNGWQLGYKKLYQDEDLIKVTEKLIKKNGSTTSEDVINRLHKDRFWAILDEVSIALDGLCDSGIFQHDFNEPRNYFFPTE